MPSTWTALGLALALAAGAVGAGCAGDDTAGPVVDPEGHSSTADLRGGVPEAAPGARSNTFPAGVGAGAAQRAVAFLSPFAAALPPGLDERALRRVAGLETAAIESCGAGAGGGVGALVTCVFALSGQREARVGYRSAASRADARFACENGAGLGARLILDGGPARWVKGDKTFTATDELCFSVQIIGRGGPDRADSFRIATALASQMGSPEPRSCEGADCGNPPL